MCVKSARIVRTLAWCMHKGTARPLLCALSVTGEQLPPQGVHAAGGGGSWGCDPGAIWAGTTRGTVCACTRCGDRGRGAGCCACGGKQCCHQRADLANCCSCSVFLCCHQAVHMQSCVQGSALFRVLIVRLIVCLSVVLNQLCNTSHFLTGSLKVGRGLQHQASVQQCGQI
jgi:hypothetical protein